MEKIRDVTSFDVLENDLIYTSGGSIYWKSKCAPIDFAACTFIHTKDYLVVIALSDAAGYAISKRKLQGSEMEFRRVPRFVNRFTCSYERNLLILLSEVFTDERSWIFSLDDNSEKEYPELVEFVPGTEYVSTYQPPVSFLDRHTGETLQRFDYSVKKQTRVWQILGLVDGNVWMCVREKKWFKTLDIGPNDFRQDRLFELVSINLKSGLKNTIVPYELISSQGVDPLFIGFGGETNHYRFHFDMAGKRIVTFANRYYCEISLVDFSVKVFDLFTISRKRICIVKSRWCPERKWLYFVGAAQSERRFDNYMGVFDTVSATILQMDRADDQDGFFGHPPIYGDGFYSAVTTEKVLYSQSVK